MAYADRNVSGSRIVAIIMVAIIVAGLGYAFVTGLAYQYVKKVADEVKTFDVDEPPPPPEEVPPPPPPPDSPVPPPPTQLVIVQPIVQPPIQQPQQFQFTEKIEERPVTKASPNPTPVPPPPPQRPAQAARPRGQPQSWVTNDDYPPAALRAEQEGTTGFELSLDASGRVTGCSITSSSGSTILDNTVCSLMRRRARFNAAEDSNGNKIPGTWRSRFRWELPND